MDCEGIRKEMAKLFQQVMVEGLGGLHWKMCYFCAAAPLNGQAPAHTLPLMAGSGSSTS